MTVNYFISCPVCGKITRMRTPAGYVESTPVRVHCMNCKTLLCGEFISDNKNVHAYYRPLNCSESKEFHFDYYGEASGEMLCNKITDISGTIESNILPQISPVFPFMQSTTEEDRTQYINYACYISKLGKTIDVSRIKYDLFLNGQSELISEKYADDAKHKGYSFDGNFSATRYIYYSLLYDCAGIFKKKDVLKLIQDVNYHFYHLDKNVLSSFIRILCSEGRLKKAQEKIFEILLSFIKIASYIIPAIGLSFYENTAKVDLDSYGISTCSFSDISKFYQDSFETLLEYCDIITGLDNIESRKDFNHYSTAYTKQTFQNQSKGNKLQYLVLTEDSFFSHNFAIPSTSSELRNAIGHNNYSYNGITQEIEYKVKDTTKKQYLVDIALECLSLTKSAFVMSFIIYELNRYHELSHGNHVPLHPLFYGHVSSQKHCPCGSHKKYKDCCKQDVDCIKTKIDDYPNESNFSMDVDFG